MKKRYGWMAALLSLVALGQMAHAATPLNQTQWELQSLSGWKGRAPSTIQPLANIGFAPNQQLYGNNSCNNFSGSYSTKSNSNQLSLKLGSSTLMACPVEQERLSQAFSKALTQTTHYKLAKDRLVLLKKRNAVVATFSKPLVAMSNTNWKVIGVNMGNAFVSSLNTEKMTAQFGKNGTLSGFSGCNQYSGRYTVNTSQGTARISDSLASTRMMCADPDVMKEEQAFLKAWSRVRNYQRMGNKLTLSDQKGLVIMTLRFDK